MSRHALDPLHYLKPETLQRERQHIFSSLWIFAGFTSMVRERNQFFTRKVAGVPVLVQRTDAGIRAFFNECPHRLSAIQTESSGKRPLVCPYHAWSFGAEGELRAIPGEGLYRFSEAERREICLRKIHVAEIGQLLFVNLSAQPVPLEQQFNDAFRAQLEEASACVDDQIVYSCHRVRYNWKLNIENVKDLNHVAFVHPKSFLPELETPGLRAYDMATVPLAAPVQMIAQSTPVSLSTLSYPNTLQVKPRRNWFADLCDTYGREDTYSNWFIYPNVNMCSLRGQHFIFQQYDPVSPGETDYHLWMMTAKRKDARTDFTALLSSLIRAERAVIAEDTVLLERLQDGIGEHSGRFMHGDYEHALVAQHLWYRQTVLEGTA